MYKLSGIYAAVGAVFLAEKIPKRGQIKLWGYRIRKAVACAGNGDKLFSGDTGIIIVLAHFAGDIVVVLSVVEDHRHSAVFNGIDGCDLFQVEFAEQFCAQLYKGVGKVRGQAHFFNDRFDDVEKMTDNLKKQLTAPLMTIQGSVQALTTEMKQLKHYLAINL